MTDHTNFYLSIDNKIKLSSLVPIHNGLFLASVARILINRHHFLTDETFCKKYPATMVAVLHGLSPAGFKGGGATSPVLVGQ
jgi:hypothetical protein